MDTNLLDIEDGLPNGFHDARLKGVEVNFGQSTLVLHLDVDMSDINESGLTEHVGKSALISGVLYVRMDGPEEHKKAELKPGPLDIAGDPHLMTELIGNSNYWVYRFFVHAWNAFITIAAEKAEWIEAPSQG